MKKNVMMRVASALLVAVLLSTCVISGTFAKYVSEGSGYATARVAHWGVTISGTALEAFKTNYDNTVVTSTTEKLVAPGTNGSLAGFAVEGTPEVDVRVNFDATLTLAGWEITGVAEYCPIIFYVDGTKYTKAAGETVATFADRVEDAIRAYSTTYEANDDLSNVNDDLQVQWEWPFEGNDYADTQLGNQAANGNAATIELAVTCTITQID
ncbi:MAG: hypothetical protein IKL13_06035 [Clostridia bacterium]|nr:hypothetical protein [Clostridia bacterium]